MKKPKDIKSRYTLPLKCESSYLKSDQHVFITSGGIFRSNIHAFPDLCVAKQDARTHCRIFARFAHFLQVSVHFFFPGQIFSLEIMFDFLV
jgi:hypothetical protein